MRRTCKRKPRQGGFFLLPNEIFTLGLSAEEIVVYAYLLFAGLPPRKAGKKAVKPDSPLCGPVCDFESQVRKRHQRNPRQALLGQCDPAVSESRTAANLDERKPAPPRRRENKRAKERQKKKKQAQPGLQRQRFGAWDSPRWKTEFSSAQRTGLERTEGSAHNPNIEQPKEGVKKEQEKE